MFVFPFPPFFFVVPLVNIPGEIWAFLGGAIGALGAYGAAYYTMKRTYEHWENEQRYRQRPYFEYTLANNPQKELGNIIPIKMPNGGIERYVIGTISLINVGAGSAHDVYITTSEPGYIQESHQHFLRVDEELLLDFGVLTSTHESISPYTIQVSYKDVNGISYTDYFKVGFRQRAPKDHNNWNILCLDILRIVCQVEHIRCCNPGI